MRRGRILAVCAVCTALATVIVTMGVRPAVSIDSTSGVADNAEFRPDASKSGKAAEKTRMNGIIFGQSKPNDELTSADIERYPIWIWAVDEETRPAQDETWVKPIIRHRNVTEDLIAYVPRLVLVVQGTEYRALGDFFAAGDIVGDHILRSVHPDATPADFVQLIQLHGAEGIVGEDGRRGLEYPVVLEAVPLVRGLSAVRFLWRDPEDLLARRLY